MSSTTFNGWKILFYPVLNEQWEALSIRVLDLKSKLSKEEFITHPDVKRLKGLDVGIKRKILQDPLALHFALQKPLQKYSRLKKMGLPSRYRLFFRVFHEQKTIIILWLGFPRKEGDKNDCYEVFTKKVKNSDFPENLEKLLAECKVELQNDGDEDEDE
jgi:toxin YhaV